MLLGARTGAWSGGKAEYGGLKFTANTAGSTLYLLKSSSSAPEVSLEYSTDGSTWETYTTSATASECTLITLANAGDGVYFRAGAGGNAGFASDYDNRHYFKMTGSIAASGNIQSMLDSSMARTSVAPYCFCQMFRACSSLTTAPELPATTLADSCYRNMFLGTSLTTAPELPATTLAAFCYAQMFMECMSLTTAPELPATTLADFCYRYMFYKSSKLKISEDGGVGKIVLNLPAETTVYSSWSQLMFTETGGSFTGTPSMGVPYYCYL